MLKALVIILLFLFDDDLICATHQAFLGLITLFCLFVRTAQIILAGPILSCLLVEIEPLQNLRAPSHLLDNQLLASLLEGLHTSSQLVCQLGKGLELN